MLKTEKKKSKHYPKKFKKGKRNAGDFLLEMAKNAVNGGPKDLSTNDDYLYRP